MTWSSVNVVLKTYEIEKKSSQEMSVPGIEPRARELRADFLTTTLARQMDM